MPSNVLTQFHSHKNLRGIINPNLQMRGLKQRLKLPKVTLLIMLVLVNIPKIIQLVNVRAA